MNYRYTATAYLLSQSCILFFRSTSLSGCYFILSHGRFCRLRQYNILYICGTDEYGTASETKVS
jgi:hypothetical protein